MRVKYSIIIPVNNSLIYLPDTIETIISQNYADYELIVSDDGSTDGTAEYVDTLTHPNIKKLHTPKRMTTAEHFDWALTYATGEWCMFVGGDDGLQPYFFKLADRLTSIADDKNIRAISSRRAYFFWNGCQPVYGNVALEYNAEQEFCICKFKEEILKVLYSNKSYFELPQMYTTSVFHSSLISDIRKKQGGKFLTYEISDANMVALSSTYEDYYLHSEIPLGWVGTSVKTINRSSEFPKLVTDTMPDVCGNYKIDSGALFLWGALHKVIQFYPEKQTYIHSKKFVRKILPYVYVNISQQKKFKETEQYKYFVEVLKVNKLTIKNIILKSDLIKTKPITKGLLIFFWRCIRYVIRRLPLVKKYFLTKTKSCFVRLTWDESPDLNYKKAQQIISNLIDKDIIFDNVNLRKRK